MSSENLSNSARVRLVWQLDRKADWSISRGRRTTICQVVGRANTGNQASAPSHHLVANAPLTLSVTLSLLLFRSSAIVAHTYI